MTGPLADALNWAGISEDDFNKKLEKCNSEQERATLITETLNKEYQAAAAEYNELTASTQEARRATSEMESAQADLGAAIEPVTTAWTNLKANALEAVLPLVQWIAEKFQELTTWMNENQTAASLIIGVIIALATALGVLAAALGISTLINTVKTAFAALNLTMSVSPITIVVAAIAGLVAAFIYLWNNCEAFRNFWINLWEKIKSMASTAWEAIKKFFSDAWAKIQEIWSGSIVRKYFQTVWNVIKGIFAVVKAVLSGNFGDAWNAIKGIWSAVSGFFASVWEKIKGVFSGIGAWFSGKFTEAKEKALGAFSNIRDKFAEIKSKILGVFSNIKTDFFSIGDNIIKGIWDGLNAGWDWLKSKVKNLANSLFTSAKNELDIKSPSRKFAYVGEMSSAGIGVGWEDGIRDVEKQLTNDLSGLTARVRASVGVQGARAGQSMGRTETGFTDLARAVGIQTAGINSLSAQYRSGAANMRPIVLELNGRELGRAVVNVSGAEGSRVGLALGGAY